MGSTSFIERYSIKKQLSITFITIMVLSIVMTVLTLGAGAVLLYSKDWLRPANHYDQMIPTIQDYVNRKGEVLLDSKASADLEQVIPSEGMQYQVVEVNGTVLYGTLGMPLITSRVELIGKLNTTEISNSKFGFGGVITKTIPIMGTDGAWDGAIILQYRMEMSASEEGSSHIVPMLIIFLLFISPFLYIALFTWIFASKLGKRINRPVSELMLASERIQKQDLDFTISYKANNEIGMLSKSFENMRLELKNALMREWTMEQERRDMLDAIAHDFRTPLTIIQGNVELLVDGGVISQERLDKHLRVIDQNVKRAIRLIQDINIASQKDMEYFPMRLEEVDLPAYLELKEQEIQYLCSHKQINSRFLVEDRRQHPNAPVLIDVERVGQVLVNIISNSIRFVPIKGEIHVRTLLQDGNIRFEITDTGPGFNGKDIPMLFQKFYRGEKGISGLGLYTSRVIVEKHGGIIQASNRQEGGACIIFTMKTNGIRNNGGEIRGLTVGENTFRRGIGIAIILLIIGTDLALLQYAQEASTISWLPLAVAIDFSLIIPVLYALQSDRRSAGKWVLVLPLMLVGYISSKVLLNANGLAEEKLLIYIILPLEMLFVVFSLFRIVLGIRHFKKERQEGKPVYDSLKRGVDKAFPLKSGVGYLIHELSMYYYALFAWKVKRPQPRLQTQPHDPVTFTYHKNSNMLVLLFFLGFVLAGEGFVVHLLLSQWSELAAWIVSVGNIYILLLFLADYRAMVLNPITIENGIVRIHYGLRAFMVIPLSNIVSVTATSLPMEITKSEKKAALAPSVDSPNIYIECAGIVEAVFMFGKKRSANKILLAVDEAIKFQKAVEASK